MTKKLNESETIDVSQVCAVFLKKSSKVIVDAAVVGRYYLVTGGKSLVRKNKTFFHWLSKLRFTEEIFQWVSEKFLFFRDTGKYTLKEFKLKAGVSRNILKKVSLPGGSRAKPQDKAALLDQLGHAVSQALPAEEEDTLTILNLDEYLEQMKDVEQENTVQ